MTGTHSDHTGLQRRAKAPNVDGGAGWVDIRRLLAAEAEIRALGVNRLGLFGSVLRGDADPTAMSTSSSSSRGGPSRLIASSIFPNCSKSGLDGAWNS